MSDELTDEQKECLSDEGLRDSRASLRRHLLTAREAVSDCWSDLLVIVLQKEATYQECRRVILLLDEARRSLRLVAELPPLAPDPERTTKAPHE